MAVDTLAQFQTAIVGVIGFTGVILTLIVNARISRMRADEAREHERIVLTRALRAELAEAAKLAEYHVGHFERQDERIVTLSIRTPINKANLSKLGLLREDHIEPVLNAYRSIELYNDALMTILEARLSGSFTRGISSGRMR